MDILPTILHLADVPVPSDRHYDGQNEIDSFLGLKNSEPVANRTIMFYCNRTLMAVRYGPFKIHFHTVPIVNQSQLEMNCPGGMPLDDMYISADCPDSEAIANDPPLVYDLLKDPFELYPLNTTTAVGLDEALAQVKELVESHKQSIGEVKDQLGDFATTVMPCCNPPKCECSGLSEPPAVESYENKGKLDGDL